MAKRTEQEPSGQDIYHGVLGYLSEDAQAALFKYLPYMEDRVNSEVTQFGTRLADDLTAAVKTESRRARKRLGKAKEGIQRFERFAKKGKARLSDRQLPIEQVAQAACEMDRMVREGTALLECMQAFAKQVAQYAVQRTPDGLQLAVDDLERALHAWCAELGRVDEAIRVAPQANATQADATQADAELGEIRSLIARLKSRVGSLGGSVHPQPHAKKEVPSRPEGGDERTSDDNAPGPAAEATAAAARAEAAAGAAAQAAASANATKAKEAARAAAEAEAAARAEEAKARAAAQDDEAARAAAEAAAAARAAEEAAASAAAEAAEMPEGASEKAEAAASAAAEARATASAKEKVAVSASATAKTAASAAKAAREAASAAKDAEATATAAAEAAAAAWAAAEDEAARAAAAELAELTWMLPARVERVQGRRTNALADAAGELQKQAAEAVKAMSEWPSKLERLRSCAEEIKQAARDLPKDFARALRACIERANLDVRGR